MENDKKSPAELVADLMLDPGFVLVPQDRYEELLRAEVERDVLEANISSDDKYCVSTIMKVIIMARNRMVHPRREKQTPEGEGNAK